MRTIIPLLCLMWFFTPPAAGQVRSSVGMLSSKAVPLEGARVSGDSIALQEHAADQSSFPSAGKVLKRTGIGTLAGIAAGAAFGGVYLVMDDHSNHEDDLILVGASMLIGAMSGVVLGLVSAFAH